MIIDVNVNLSRWPFRRLPCDQKEHLLQKLKQNNVEQAWAGSFDGLLHQDIGGVNERLAQACNQSHSTRLVPFGTINLKLPDWEEDLRRCHEDYHMPGVRLHPNYHGYTLDDPAFADLLSMAEERNLLVQLVLRMEDLRTQHPLMQVADVDIGPLPKLLATRSKLRLILLNGLKALRGKNLKRLVDSGQVYAEIAMLEGVGSVGSLLSTLPSSRLLFGSHFPLFNLESAILKMKEAELERADRLAILFENAARLIKNSSFQTQSAR